MRKKTQIGVIFAFLWGISTFLILLSGVRFILLFIAPFALMVGIVTSALIEFAEKYDKEEKINEK